MLQLEATNIMSSSSESREGWGRFGSLNIPPDMVALLAGSPSFAVLPLSPNLCKEQCSCCITRRRVT